MDRKKISQKWQDNCPESFMLSRARSRAKSMGIDFDLTIEDIVIPKMCPVLGIELFRKNGRQGPNSPSLDRVDNTKGYVKGNVVVVSLRANSLKKDASIKEMVQLAMFYAPLLST